MENIRQGDWVCVNPKHHNRKGIIAFLREGGLTPPYMVAEVFMESAIAVGSIQLGHSWLGLRCDEYTKVIRCYPKDVAKRNRTRKKQKLTRLQRRRKRQNKY